MGDRDPKVVAVTAAMSDGTGLKRFHNMFPDRFFDVGIAEEHAVTFAAGLAASGLKPVFAVYSTFLQRAYDQILHDVALQNLHVVFAIDRAGLVGPDGETHQGIFDLSYLSTIPNMVVMAPKNKWELSDMMKFALNYDGPVAIRYPKGKAYDGLHEMRPEISLGKAEVLFQGPKKGELKKPSICLFAIGSMVATAVKVREMLLDMGIEVTVTNVRFAKPLDCDYIREASQDYDWIVTMEENVRSGGMGMHVADLLCENPDAAKLFNVSIPDGFIHQGTVTELQKLCEIDPESVVRRIRSKIFVDIDL